MKRKAEAQPAGKSPKRTKKALTRKEATHRFRKSLFDPAVLDAYTNEYATSAPYKHAVIHELVNDSLLRAVRDEIRENVSFTPKETDIYKIHQSGDLANLDGLDDEALAKLPSLLALRDALYSGAFRDYVARITGCGALSGRKTDMAINVYTPGCYLLCHDDVIGSRKVSYILYLTDPDTPWQPAWGGALRLFPVDEQRGAGGAVAKTPAADPVKTIPPAWNQLSFFAVQPGESFHDVEEVYHAATPEDLARDGGRVRMAISGWFHIPQPGEDGFVPGAEAAQAENSGLMQLQGNPDQHDRPLPKPVGIVAANSTDDSQDSKDSRASHEFSEADLEFLLRYLAPSYLTPDTLTEIAEQFDENSSITLPTVLNARFAERLRAEIVAEEGKEEKKKDKKKEKKKDGDRTAWSVALPPHKHRFLYRQQGEAPPGSAWHELLDVLLPSMPFRTWLEMATSTTVASYDVLARRFRRGKDYTLATGYEGPPRLELNLGLTPTEGWGDEDEEEEEEEGGGEEEEKGGDEEEEKEEGKKETNGKSNGHAKGTNGKKKKEEEDEVDDNDDDEKEEKDGDDGEVGGHEVYMAGDDDKDDDAAIYRASGDDDNILFFQAAAWNKMTLVLRDSGTLRFIKYVSRKAPGDRWDVSATFAIEEDGDDDDGGEQGDGQAESSSEEEFNGFSSSEDSDSE